MAGVLQPGDRIKIPTGEAGTVIRTNGGLAQIQLDNSLRVTIATAVLQKIEEEEAGKDSQ